ncbi:HK97 gp10 family phage protein [Microbacterium sp. HD4P20]|uniref:HK97 gp10 family phage protein n=1 Tax=Microbacterium sp. HD4P20 TaxID=2864874 RepID=UPI001C63C844|nr:HK97 gp10 family phage protein [Microbacterium sp. HD4P20]MCP2636766.1 HK97 gp10 family phage protein [Microbacterium sp. HD4P20]
MPVIVQVYDSRIAAAFQPGGMVFGEMRSMSRQNRTIAKANAPVRTGRVRDSIESDVQPSGVFSTTYRVGVGEDYAPFVLGGTSGPITAKRGPRLMMRPAPYSHLPVNPSPGSGGRWPFKSVRGQAANDFLTESLRATFALRGLV